MKGIVQQMREAKVEVWGIFTEEDLDNIDKNLKIAAEKDLKYRKERLKELEDNRKALVKRSRELGKEIPFELAYHCYLSYAKTYVGSEFLEKYKDWL